MNWRLDRLLTLHFVGPLTRRGTAAHGIPVLMYHSISNELDSRSHPYFRTVTSPRVFAEQMEYLHGEGYEVIKLPEVASALEGGPADVKRVAITFDDGFADFASNAFPSLEKYGFSATVFLPTAYTGDSPQVFMGRRCLCWDQIRDLKQAGIDFGSHTVTHRQLQSLAPDEIREELVASKQTLEDKLGCPAGSFAYPFAFPQANKSFTRLIHSALREAGYRQGVCTTIGTVRPHDSLLMMKRLPVNADDDARLFSAKLAGGYDWLEVPQRLAKKIKEPLRRKRASRIFLPVRDKSSTVL